MLGKKLYYHIKNVIIPLQNGFIQNELSYKKRLIHVDLFPLTYDREVKDLVFLYKALYGYIDIDITWVLVTAIRDDLNQVI